MIRRALPSSLGFAIVLLLVSVSGYGRPGYKIAEVDGVLFIKGQPGHKVRIEFVPDVGVDGPISAAETDDRGRFIVHVMERDGSSPAGAVVGMHKVTLSDLQLAESPTGTGVPIRFGAEYSMSSSTPLTQEVKEDNQAIKIEIH